MITFDKFLELLPQDHSVRPNIIENRECLSLPKEKQKLRENDENQEKAFLMENIENLRLLVLEKLQNLKSLFLSEVIRFISEFLQSCVMHSFSEQIRGNSTREILTFINHLEEQILFISKQSRNKERSKTH